MEFIVQVLLFVVVPSMFLVAAFVSYLCVRRIRRPFEEIAFELGLEYKKGFWWFLGRPVRVIGKYRKHDVQIYVHTSGLFGRTSSATYIKIKHVGSINDTIRLSHKDYDLFVKTKYKSGRPEFDSKFRFKGDEALIENIFDYFVIEKILDLKKLAFIKIKPREIILEQ